MKKIITILFVLFSLNGFSQYPITQNLGSASTLVQNPNYGGLKGGLIPYTFSDTSNANSLAPYLANYCGALIYTTDVFATWYRSCDSSRKHWVMIQPQGGGTPLAGQSWINPRNNNLFTDANGNGGFGTIAANGISHYTNNTLRFTEGGTGVLDNATASIKYLAVDTTIGGQRKLVFAPAPSATVPISSLTAATAFNSINNSSFNQQWSWNTLGGNYGLLLTSNSTVANGNGQILFASQIQGANSNSNQTTFAGNFVNQHTGTGSTNIALSLQASGGSNNYGLQIVDGSQGAGKILSSDASGNASWIPQSSIASGTTLQQAINNGSTLNQFNTIHGGGQILLFDENNIVNITARNAGAQTNTTKFAALSLDSLGTTELSTQGINTYGGGLVSLHATDVQTAHETYIRAYGDSVWLAPSQGIATIDTLALASSTTNANVMVWNTVTKRWEQTPQSSIVVPTPGIDDVLAQDQVFQNDRSMNGVGSYSLLLNGMVSVAINQPAPVETLDVVGTGGITGTVHFNNDGNSHFLSGQDQASDADNSAVFGRQNSITATSAGGETDFIAGWHGSINNASNVALFSLKGGAATRQITTNNSFTVFADSVTVEASLGTVIKGNVGISSLTPSQLVGTDASKNLVSLSSLPSGVLANGSGTTINGTNKIDLGGTLTSTDIIFGNSLYGTGFSNHTSFQVSDSAGDTRIDMASTLSGTQRTQLLSGKKQGRQSFLTIKPDSLQLQPSLGNLFVDSLNNSASQYILHWNKTTGAVTYADSSASSSGLTVGTTTIASGTTGRIEYNNSGVLGEYTLTGSGTVVAMQTSPAFLGNPTISPTSTSATGLTINEPTSFSGNIQDWQVNGSSKVAINQAGSLTVQGAINGSTSGIIVPTGGNGFKFSGGGFMVCPSDGIFTFQNNAANNFNRLQFGDVTSSYPSLKRSGTSLQVRLADDSGDGGFSTGALTATGALSITAGSNKSVGTGTLIGGTATISNSRVTASSLIFLTDATTGALTNVGTLTVGTISAGVSFVVNSANPLDTSSFNFLIIN